MKSNKKDGCAAIANPSSSKNDQGFLHEKALSRWRARPVIDLASPQEWLWFAADRAREIHPATRERVLSFEDSMYGLGWSHERIALFCQYVSEYAADPTIERFLRLRQEFPDVELQVGPFDDQELDELCLELQEYFATVGIDCELFSAALPYGDELAVDALCLHILELITKRDSAPHSGPGFIDRRRRSISDTDVRYLIFLFLRCQQSGLLPVRPWQRMPSSFIALTRRQLCHVIPDVEASYMSRFSKRWTAMFVGQQLGLDETPSVRRLSKIAGIPTATASRWLKDPLFLQAMQEAKEWTSEGIEPVDCPPFRSRRP